MFTPYDIKFKRGDEWVIVCGQVRNDSNRDYELVVFRIVLFDKNHAIGAGIIKLTHFRKHIAKSFEKTLIGLSCELIPHIERYDMMVEQGS